MISVIVATYNRAGPLTMALHALTQQKGGFEVIIADDGSDDDTENVARWDWGIPIRYCWHKHHLFGLARTRNDGARLAKGNLLHFIDSDILLAPGSLTAAWELYVQNPRSPVGGYYGYLPQMPLLPEDIKQEWGLLERGQVRRTGEIQSFSPLFPDMRETWMKGGRIGVNVFDYEHEPLWSPLCFLGANMMIPRYCFEKVGGFDEHFTEYGGEDAEMSLALISHGFGIRYSKRVRGLHMWHKPNENANPESEKRHLQYLFEKYPDYWVLPGQPNPALWGKPVEETP